MSEIISVLENITGFIFDKNQKKDVRKQISEKALKKGFSCPKAYCRFLNSLQGRKDLCEIINAVTVGETYFFRNKNHWAALKEHILPCITKQNIKKRHNIRIWSAGCSTGEEAYSMAISLNQYFYSFKNPDIMILASDINSDSLEKARQGIYTKHSFRGMDKSCIEKYFTKKGNRVQVKEEIRNMVLFERFNLNTLTGFSEKHKCFDAVFCRNALMYFLPANSRKAVKNLSLCLRENGFLVLGHAEGSLGRSSLLKPVSCCGTIIFQKITQQKQLDVSLHEKPAEKAVPAKKILTQSFGAHPVLQEKDKPKTGKKQENTGSCVYEKALDCYYREDYSIALDILLSCNLPKPGQFKIHLLEAMILLGMSEFEKLEKKLALLFEISETSPEIHMINALFYEAKKDYTGAIKANTAAIFMDRSFFAPQFRMGNIYQGLGNREKSLKYFSNSLKILHKDSDERIKLFTGELSKQMLKNIVERRLNT